MSTAKTALSDFEYRVLNLLCNKPCSATVLAERLSFRQPIRKCEFVPAQLATSHLNRLRRRGFIFKDGILWYATELGLNLFCTEHLNRFPHVNTLEVLQ